MQETLKVIFRQIRSLELSTNRSVDSQLIGNYRSAFKGSGIEFADIRSYDRSDDARSIDWKTSSRMQELYVKTYQETRENTVVVCVDCSPSFYFTTTGVNKFQKVLEVIALLGISALKSGDSFGAILYQKDIKKIIPPKKGKRQLWKILKEVWLAFDRKENQKSDPLKGLNTAKYLFRHHTTFFWITDQLDLSESLKKSLRFMTRKHDFIPILIQDDAEKNFPETGLFILQDPISLQAKTVAIDVSVQKEFNRIRKQKLEVFKHFFQHQKTEIVEILTTDNVYKKLFLLFKQRQYHA